MVGFITFDTPEASLWWPLWTRRIEHVSRDDTPETLAARGRQYMLAPTYCYEFSFSVEDARRKFNAADYRKIPLQLRAQYDAEDWYILEVKPPGDVSPRP